MKKIAGILMFSLALSMFSCSDDTTQADNTSVVQTKALTGAQVTALRNQMNVIKNSTAWRDMRAQSALIAQKMNYQSATINTRAQFISWIDANLSSTTFASKAEAIQMFDNLIAKSNLVIAQNQSFYSGLVNASPGQLPVILEPILNAPITTTGTPCEDGCNHASDVCLGNADNFLCEMQQAGAEIDDNGGDGGLVTGTAQIGFDTMVKNCNDGLTACLAACHG